MVSVSSLPGGESSAPAAPSFTPTSPVEGPATGRVRVGARDSFFLICNEPLDPSLLALDEGMVSVVHQSFAVHKVRKTYYALVKDWPSPDSGCWKDVLKRDAYRTAKVAKFESGGFAQTHYQVMSKPNGNIPISLIKLMPVTGRTHQLRIQCSQHRHPIVGDRTHGDFKFNRRISSLSGEKRMMLHSAELDFGYRIRGKEYRFNARSELPEAFTKLLESNRQMQ